MTDQTTPPPKLSVIVVIYNMRREAPRTLHALSTAYQRGINANDYEVILVENGGTERLSEAEVTKFGSQFRYFYIDKASPSPASAVNFGITQARGASIGVMIDGARIPSPGLLRQALQALSHFPRAIVTTISMDIGPDMHLRSLKAGYNMEIEDRLLAAINWPDNGYRLYEISSLGTASEHGVFGRIAETNSLFMPADLFRELGGYDEAFDLPGGGLVNHDTFIRACQLPYTHLIRLLGEATFHHAHERSLSSVPVEQALAKYRFWREHYEKLRGVTFERFPRDPIFYGEITPEVLPLLQQSLTMAQNRQHNVQLLHGAAFDAPKLTRTYQDFTPHSEDE